MPMFALCVCFAALLCSHVRFTTAMLHSARLVHATASLSGEEHLVNAIGGCCGSTPEHIAAIREMASAYPPRERHAVPEVMRLSGLEPLNYQPNEDNMRETFLMIGERCNVAGSIMYKKAIVDGDYDKAMSIALSQVFLTYWECGQQGSAPVAVLHMHVDLQAACISILRLACLRTCRTFRQPASGMHGCY